MLLEAFNLLLVLGRFGCASGLVRSLTLRCGYVRFVEFRMLNGNFVVRMSAARIVVRYGRMSLAARGFRFPARSAMA